MKIYLAAPWTHKSTAEAIAAILERDGHTPTCRWWLHVDEETLDSRRQQLEEDLAGVRECEVFAILCLAVSEGKATELGYALALEKPIVAFVHPSNPSSNIFLNSARVQKTETVEGFVEAINAYATI